MDAHVDVHAARAARLGPASQSHFLEQILGFDRDAAHVVPRDTWTRIEIDAQLVGVVEIARAHGVRMQLDASQVHDPRETGGIVHDDFFGGSPRRKRERDRSQPRRPAFRRALLIERLALGAIHEALEHERPIADPGDRARRDREVILHDVELRELDAAREVRLVRIRDPNLAPFDREHLGRFFLRHRYAAREVTEIAAHSGAARNDATIMCRVSVVRGEWAERRKELRVCRCASRFYRASSFRQWH